MAEKEDSRPQCVSGQGSSTVRRTAQQQDAAIKTESLDYHEIRNSAETKGRTPTWFVSRSVCGIKPNTLIKLVVTIAIGVTVGMLAVGLAIGTETIIKHKNIVARDIIHDGHPAGVLRAALAHMAFSIGLACIGSILVNYCFRAEVQFVAPQAGGAGVSLIIAYLNGSAISRLLDWKTLVVKWVGTILAVSSNMALGPEAPMVHLGAAVAHVYTHLTCVGFSKFKRLQRYLLCCFHRGAADNDVNKHDGPLSIIYSDAQRREFICAGASAGIAAAFGAPIGGVLFSMEETATHWSRKVAWRCFLCTTVSVYTLAQLHPRWRNGILSFHGIAEMENREWFTQLPFIFVVSVCGGLLGALFNWAHEKIFAIRAKRDNHLARITEVGGIAAFTVGSMFFLAWWLGRCVEVPSWKIKNYGYSFHCNNGRYNDLATAYLSSADDTIRHIFSLGELSPKSTVCAGADQCYFTMRSLIILCPTYLFFMSLSAGIAIPGGLFMPTMLVGGSFGATVGLFLLKWLPGWNIQPGVYAMCAATAMLGGVFRASISLVVLLVEGTQSTKFMLGIIIAVICSNWIGDWILTEGVYETDLERDGSVVFLRPAPPEQLYKKRVGDFMAAPVWCFREVESLERIQKVLEETTHNGFPVVKHVPRHTSQKGSGSTREDRSIRGPLVGTVLRSQLIVVLESQNYCDKHGEPLSPTEEDEQDRVEYDLDRKMRLFYRCYSQHSHLRESILDAHKIVVRDHRGQLEAEKETSPDAIVAQEAQAMEEARQRPLGALYVDLRPFMDQAPITVRPETPAERAHIVFLSLGLRHLPVIDENSTVQGIVTRKDLDHVADVGPWRRNKASEKATTVREGSTSSAVRLAKGIIHSFSFTPHRSPSEQPLLGSDTEEGSSLAGRRSDPSSSSSRDEFDARRSSKDLGSRLLM